MLKLNNQIISNLGLGLLAIFVIIIYLFLIYFPNYDQSRKEGFYGGPKHLSFICYLFYTNKCPHSLNFLNTHWKNISQKYSNKMTFVTVDCYDTENKNFCKALNLKDVPRILVVKDRTDINNNNIADKTEFVGERTASNFENFIVDQINLH
jgi:hypothetical protein